MNAGIVAALCGAQRVTLSDLAPLLPLLRRNAAANNVADRCAVLELEWGGALPATLLEPNSLDVILGSDVTAFVQACTSLSVLLG